VSLDGSFQLPLVSSELVKMSNTLLFLYGTLKRGMKSAHFLEGQEFVGEATTMPMYRLYGCGWHPGLVLDLHQGLEVKGELWAVDANCLSRLDEYEGVPTAFVRADIAVRDTFQTVQAYFFNGPIPPGAISGSEWPFPS
jgi:gamma-glutamylaminecyclotransferase